MRRGGIAAFAARAHSFGADSRPKLDDGDEAIAVTSEDVLRHFRAAPLERCERPVFGGGERHRDAWAIIAELRRDRRGDALEAVDLAPRYLPAAEVAPQLRHRVVERSEFLRWGRVARDSRHV